MELGEVVLRLMGVELVESEAGEVGQTPARRHNCRFGGGRGRNGRPHEEAIGAFRGELGLDRLLAAEGVAGGRGGGCNESGEGGELGEEEEEVDEGDDEEDQEMSVLVE